jgi:hypothetical protein
VTLAGGLYPETGLADGKALTKTGIYFMIDIPFRKDNIS